MSFYYPDGEGGKKLIVTESTYSLPTASKTTKGGIKPGNALEMNNDTLNATVMTGATASAAGKLGLAPAPAKGQQNTFLRGDGTWASPADTTYSTMKGASSTAAGASGLVPAPAKGQQNTFLRGDGTWASPADTTYSTMKGASSTAAGASGLVPAPAKGQQNTFLRGDGVWTVPADTTYPVATTTANGLMSATDKVKLNGLQNATVMTGATSTAAGKLGLAPAPAKGQENTFLCGNGKWSVPPYMPISGGTFTGNINIGTTSAPKNIVLPTIGSGIGNVHNSRSFSGMRLVGQAVQDSMSYGCDVLVQGGNKLILSAGEAGIDLYHSTVAGANSIPADTKESIYLVADSNIVMKTNCGSIPASKTFTFDATGNLTANKFTGDLAGNATSATKDSSNNVIASTYVKNITSSNGALTLTKGNNSTFSVPIPSQIKPGNGLSMSDDGTLNRDSTFTDRVTLKAGFVVPSSVSSNFASHSTISAERTKADFSYATLEADHTSIKAGYAKIEGSGIQFDSRPKFNNGIETKNSVKSIFGSHSTIEANTGCVLLLSNDSIYAQSSDITVSASKIHADNSDVTGTVTFKDKIDIRSATFDADHATIDVSFGDINARQSTVNADYAAIDGDHVSIDTRYATINTQSSDVSIKSSNIYTDRTTISGTPYFSQGLRISTVESSQEGAIWYVP